MEVSIELELDYKSDKFLISFSAGISSDEEELLGDGNDMVDLDLEDISSIP